MVKTTFGMPGPDSEAKGGDPIAPRGIPGATSTGAVPSAPMATSQQGSLPGKGPGAPSAPAAAKPIAAPMAKPAAPGRPIAPPATRGGAAPARTMFGIPAAKVLAPLPAQPAAPVPIQTRHRTTPPQGLPLIPQAKISSGPAAPAQASGDDAYKETMLGMAAPDADAIAEADKEQAASDQEADNLGAPFSDGSSPLTTRAHSDADFTPSGPAGRGSVRMGEGYEDSSALPKRGLSTMMLVLIIAGAVIVVGVIIVALWMMLSKPAAPPVLMMQGAAQQGFTLPTTALPQGMPAGLPIAAPPTGMPALPVAPAPAAPPTAPAQ